eukprot:441399-Rhodomonas_salina.2
MARDCTRVVPCPLLTHAVQVGDKQGIAAFDVGLLGMRAGGRRRLVVPPHMAYGAEGGLGGRVPPQSIWDDGIRYEMSGTDVTWIVRFATRLCCRMR